MSWSTFLAGVTVVSVFLMLTTGCAAPPRQHYPLAEPLSPAFMRASGPEPYMGSSHGVSCTEDGWCF